MFAILLTDKMDGFYSIIVSFPTIIFTVLLIVCVFYWLISFLGLVDIDALDLDADTGSDSSGGVNTVAGLAMKLGLNGVPLPIVVTFISLIAWFVSYYATYFASKYLPDLIELVARVGIFVISLWVAVLLTARIIRPLRAFFKQAEQDTEKKIIGQLAIVRTGRVDENFGEATVADGGAGLMVKVRPYKNETFKRGDRVILLEYLEELNIYKIISEADFKN